MTIPMLYNLAKKVRLSEILLTLLLIWSVWANRPPTIYINRTKGTDGRVLYNVCAKHHRWGTATTCGFADPDHDKVDRQTQAFVQQLDDMSIKTEWRTY